jgi:hypothetical protein
MSEWERNTILFNLRYSWDPDNLRGTQECELAAGSWVELREYAAARLRGGACAMAAGMALVPGLQISCRPIGGALAVSGWNGELATLAEFLRYLPTLLLFHNSGGLVPPRMGEPPEGWERFASLWSAPFISGMVPEAAVCCTECPGWFLFDYRRGAAHPAACPACGGGLVVVEAALYRAGCASAGALREAARHLLAPYGRADGGIGPTLDLSGVLTGRYREEPGGYKETKEPACGQQGDD